MGWSRLHHKRSVKPPRHARVPLCVSHCGDCGNELPITHQFSLFGGRCYSCWSVSSRFLADALSPDVFFSYGKP
jgi:hypothetical protein